MIESRHKHLSIRKQCKLLSVNRSGLYYKQAMAQSDITLENEITDLWCKMPFYGRRRITAELRRRGHKINTKQVARLMRKMNLKALYPKPQTTVRNKSHKTYHYLLKGLEIDSPNKVWATDITYLKTGFGFVYLAAIIDIRSRCIISWRLSNTLDTHFCLEMLDEALSVGCPQILNTDQGSQFTSKAWIDRVEKAGILVSMDGKGRWADNVIIERFWRTFKHEHFHLYSFDNVTQIRQSIKKFIELYNYHRLHQSLGYKTPAEVYGLQRATNKITIKTDEREQSIFDNFGNLIMGKVYLN